MDEISLLKYLKKANGDSIYGIMSEFKLSRTAALYHIDQLLKLSLITTLKAGRSITYLPKTGKQISDFFKEKIAVLTKDFEEITSQNTSHHHKSRNKKLTLSILNYYDITTQAKEELSNYYTINDYSDTQLYIPEDEFIARSKNADVVLNNYATRSVTGALLDQLPNLQYMHLSTHMYRYVDLNACRARNIRVSNIPYTYKSIAVTEFLLSQTFALLRDTIKASTQVQSGVNDFRYFKGEQLAGKKAILFGTDIGTKDLSERLKALGVDVAIYTEDKSQEPAFYGLSHFASREEVFETGDIFYAAWTGDEDRTLIGKLNRSVLDSIKRPVYIVSIYKHGFVDFQRIRELIYDGLIKGIAFDYYPDISDGDSRTSEVTKLLYLPNVLITPDIAWYTQNSVLSMNKYTNERLIAYAQGKDDYLIV